MNIYTAEQEIDIETHDLLGPALSLEKAQELCQRAEDRRTIPSAVKALEWHESHDGLVWQARRDGIDYWITKWEVT